MNAQIKTLASPVEFKGPGVHHNVDAVVRVLPAEEGIRFRRTDVEGSPVWLVGDCPVGSLPG
ncbi:MAG: UDP-3-O-acyl-N-acetylglucosamine deacetylase, partial [Planctomycetes bacterium]|nr:UDP-3-O-acyl-N-acetylglucosamine deacetylase [Planctomycetota bacterium]